MQRLFVYGTLLAPEVLVALLGRLPAQKPAVLHNFARWRLREFPEIPAVIQTEGAKVYGNVLEDLGQTELRLLDYYEDEGYVRKLVNVVDESGGQIEANVYCWPADSPSHLAVGEDWSFEEFRRDRLADFVDDVVAPCREAFESEVNK